MGKENEMELATNLAPEVQLPQDVTPQFSSLFNYLNKLEEFQQTIIELIPFATDEQIAQTRERGEAMGGAGWRIVCACDAESKRRAEKLKGGRGKKDEEGVGKVAAVKEQSKKTKKSDAQTYRNAQIYETFKTTLSDQNSLLDEKGYFEQALRTPKPKQTIKIFQKEKSDNPNFTVADAKRLAQAIREQRERVVIPDVEGYVDPDFKSFLVEVENTLTSFRNRCQRPEFTVRLDSWIRATRFERARTPQKDYEAVRDQVDRLASTVEEIAEEVYLAPERIRNICEQIIKNEPDTYEWRPIGANTDMARGSRSQGIFRKDHPHYEGGGYTPTVDWEE